MCFYPFSGRDRPSFRLSFFLLLQGFVLSCAFAHLVQLHQEIHYLSECAPLTHFCRALRLENLYRAGVEFYAGDLLFLFLGAIVTFFGAGLLLKRIQE